MTARGRATQENGSADPSPGSLAHSRGRCSVAARTWPAGGAKRPRRRSRAAAVAVRRVATPAREPLASKGVNAPPVCGLASPRRRRRRDPRTRSFAPGAQPIKVSAVAGCEAARSYPRGTATSWTLRRRFGPRGDRTTRRRRRGPTAGRASASSRASRRASSRKSPRASRSRRSSRASASTPRSTTGRAELGGTTPASADFFPATARG